MIFLILISCAIGATAQDEQQQVEIRQIDILYTVNGSMWKGKILSWDTSKVVFETTSGLTMTFKPMDVKRVRQRVLKPRRAPRPYAFREHGVYQVVQFASSSGPNSGISATYAIGHRFSRMLGIGGGLGYENFELDEGKRILPLFAEVRGFTRSTKISPYYAARVGYGIAFGDEERGIVDSKGGFLANPEVGVRFGGHEVANFYFGIGAHFQKAEYWMEWPWSETRIHDRVWYQRTEFKFGLVF